MAVPTHSYVINVFVCNQFIYWRMYCICDGSHFHVLALGHEKCYIRLSTWRWVDQRAHFIWGPSASVIWWHGFVIWWPVPCLVPYSGSPCAHYVGPNVCRAEKAHVIQAHPHLTKIVTHDFNLLCHVMVFVRSSPMLCYTIHNELYAIMSREHTHTQRQYLWPVRRIKYLAAIINGEKVSQWM